MQTGCTVCILHTGCPVCVKAVPYAYRLYRMHTGCTVCVQAVPYAHRQFCMLNVISISTFCGSTCRLRTMSQPPTPHAAQFYLQSFIRIKTSAGHKGCIARLLATHPCCANLPFLPLLPPTLEMGMMPIGKEREREGYGHY